MKSTCVTVVTHKRVLEFRNSPESGLRTELEAVLFLEPVQAPDECQWRLEKLIMREPPAKRPKGSADDVKKLLREDSDRVKLVPREGEGPLCGKNFV